MQLKEVQPISDNINLTYEGDEIYSIMTVHNEIEIYLTRQEMYDIAQTVFARRYSPV